MRRNERNALLIKAKQEYGTYDVSGKSFKINQLVEKGNFPDDFNTYFYIYVSYETASSSNGVLTIVPNGGSTGNNTYGFTINNTGISNMPLVNGHKYLMTLQVKNTQSDDIRFRLGNYTEYKSVSANTWTQIGCLVNYVSGSKVVNIVAKTDSLYTSSDTIQFRNFIITDLTDIDLGTITTLSQFYATPQGQYLQKVGYIPYNTGSIVDGRSPLEFQMTQYNQYIKSANSGTLYELTLTRLSEFSIKMNGTLGSETRYVGVSSNQITTIANHKYFALSKLESGSITGGDNAPRFNLYSLFGRTYAITSENIITATSSITSNAGYIIYPNSVCDNAVVSFQLIDLTQLYGAGNEPTTIEQFWNSDLGKLIKKVGYLPYSTTNKPYFKTSLLYELPNDYQEVEYIESTGTQYIDTGITNEKLDIDCKIKPTNSDTATYGFAFGYRTDSGVNHFLCPIKNASSYIFQYGNSTNGVQVGSSYNNVYTLFTNGNKITLNGTTTTVNEYTFTKYGNIYLFALNQDGLLQTRPQNKTQIYYFRMYQNGKLVRNFIPCYRRIDGEIGMYDTINDVFYFNQGTGNFTKGADVVHTRIYLKSAGNAHDVYRNTTGKITKWVESVDLGTLTWATYGISNDGFASTGISTFVKKPTTSGDKANIQCGIYETTDANDTYSYHRGNKIIAVSASGQLCIYDSSMVGKTTAEFKTAMSGVILNYERSSSLTETTNIPSIRLPRDIVKCVDGNGVELGIERR